MKTIIAFGTFDLLHPGHIRYLESAKAMGGRLVVVIARDDSVMMLKGRKPLFDQNARLKMVGSLKMVDKAILGNRLDKREDIYNIFKRCRPDIIVLGYDQNADVRAMRKWLSKKKMRAKIVRLRVRLNDKVYKSSKLRKRLALK